MKYFVTSDIHGYYTELITALNKAGYQKDNKDHTLIVLGDIFDRGRQPLQVYNFLKSIPEDRLILIRGNHEDCFLMAVEDGLDDVVDVENGTAQTIADILGTSFKSLGIFVGEPIVPMFNNEIYKFLKSDRWKQYVEIGKYIFVHSYIPTVDDMYMKDWRKLPSSSRYWDYAHFVDADSEMSKHHSFDEEIKGGKILVSGHRPTEYLHRKYEGISGDNSIFRSDHYINIDASVYASGFINVFTFTN